MLFNLLQILNLVSTETKLLSYKDLENTTNLVFTGRKYDSVKLGKFSEQNPVLHLEIRNTSITEISKDFEVFDFLNSLAIRFNVNVGKDNLASIGNVKNLEFLTQLILEGNGIVNLSPEIAKARNLASIYIDENKLETLPKEIGDLDELIDLFVHSKELRFLPDSIGNMRSLVGFSVIGSKIDNLPSSIKFLSRLKELTLEDNKNLTALPSEIGNLPRLTHLFLTGNNLRLIPKSFEKLANTLEYFNISLNPMQLESDAENYGMNELRRIFGDRLVYTSASVNPTVKFQGQHIKK